MLGLEPRQKLKKQVRGLALKKICRYTFSLFILFYYSNIARFFLCFFRFSSRHIYGIWRSREINKCNIPGVPLNVATPSCSFKTALSVYFKIWRNEMKITEEVLDNEGTLGSKNFYSNYLSETVLCLIPSIFSKRIRS